jgi:hypothetical protein
MLLLLLWKLCILYYFVIACLLFFRWLDFFVKDSGMTKEQRRFSVVILAIATLFWPISVPFSYLELLKSQQKIINVADKSVKNNTQAPENPSTNTIFGKGNY